jgi:hypothetical protein
MKKVWFLLLISHLSPPFFKIIVNVSPFYNAAILFQVLFTDTWSFKQLVAVRGIGMCQIITAATVPDYTLE